MALFASRQRNCSKIKQSLAATGCHLSFVLFIYVAATPYAVAATEASSSRSIYLNGKDISSVRSSEMKNVTININEQGDVFIIGPQYQVNDEDTYIPLKKYVQGLNQPEHHSPAAAGAAAQVGDTQKYIDPATAKSGLPAGGDSNTANTNDSGHPSQLVGKAETPEVPASEVLGEGQDGLEKPGTKDAGPTSEGQVEPAQK